MQKKDLSIIIVDDLQFSREVVKSGLSKMGYEDLRTAASADEAMHLLNERRAHVVLADFWMPGMNGLEMTDLIRRWDENNDRYTGIVLITAEDTSSSIVVAFDRGVDDFVSKSANQLELSARVFGAGRYAYQQNELRERMRQLSAQLLNVQQHSLQDPETDLPNRMQLESHVDSMIEHCNTRGGGLGVALIEIQSTAEALRPGIVKAIASSIQLSLRPMDMVSRYDNKTFAVSLQYPDPDAFNLDMFSRLIERVRRQVTGLGEHEDSIGIAIGIWHGHAFSPAPSFAEIIDQAKQDMAPIE